MKPQAQMKLTAQGHRKLISLALLVLATALPVRAGTSGQLSGLITDEGGSPLAAVRVSASSPAQIGGTQLTETGAGGRFLYPRLAPGYYTVKIELDGFLTQELTEVQVRLDRMTEVDVVLPEATFGEEVSVVETTPVVDPSQVSTGQTFTTEYLVEGALGMDNRHYLRLLNQAAGVQPGGGFGARVLGSTQFENAYLIDGIETTDPADQLASFTNLSFEAVDEIALHTSGLEAEYGLAPGGVVNLVTKSGGNAFSGSLDLRFRDNDLAASGDHFDPDAEPAERRDLNASLGGPMLRDRLWFFTALQRVDTRFTPSGSPSTADREDQNLLLKLTWQAGPSWSLGGKVLANPFEIGNGNASRFRAPEATAKADWELANSHVELQGVLSKSLLYGLRIADQASSLDILPDNGDLTTIGHFNLATGEFTGSYGFQNYDDRERRSIDTDLAWFADGFAGSHEVKGGVRYTDTGYARDSCANGSGAACAPGVEGYFFDDFVDAVTGDPVPAVFYVQEARGLQDFTGSIASLYLQDGWRPRPDLTVKAGLRWDRARQQNDVGREIADLSLVQPRLGVAWDVRGNGRNLVRASWGKSMHPSSLHIADFSSERSTPLEVWRSCSLFVSPDPDECSTDAAAGLGYRTDPEGWDPAGWYLRRVSSSTPGRTSPGLEPMYADQLVVAFERELFRRTSLELSYVRKETRDLLEDTCNGNVPTPTADAECGHYVVINIPGARRNYEGWLLRFESRALDRIHLIGSWVYSESRGSIGGFDLTSGFDLYPFHFVNRYGFARLPYDLTLGFGGYWSSEFRWTPVDRIAPPYGTLFVEPRGSRRHDGDYQLDLQLAKGLRIGPTRVRLLGTVYNALGTERPVEVCEVVSGCGEFALGEAIAWQRPRRFEVGIRVEF